MAMTDGDIDPRIRRTRHLLQEALCKLLAKKDFDSISVQDIAAAATINRVTFYDHYPDKFALLECMVASRFQELLGERAVKFDGTCASALTGMVLALCDYLANSPGMDNDRNRLMEPHMESAIIAVLRRMILDGLQENPSQKSAPEMRATALSWAIYGAAQEWIRTPNRSPSEEIAGTVVTLVSPLLGH
jgi:AcrR family transcriptional regulator